MATTDSGVIGDGLDLSVVSGCSVVTGATAGTPWMSASCEALSAGVGALTTPPTMRPNASRNAMEAVAQPSCVRRRCTRAVRARAANRVPRRPSAPWRIGSSKYRNESSARSSVSPSRRTSVGPLDHPRSMPGRVTTYTGQCQR